MKDYVVTVLYQDANDVTQQELFEVSAKSAICAQTCIEKMLTDEGASITYIKVN